MSVSHKKLKENVTANTTIISFCKILVVQSAIRFDSNLFGDQISTSTKKCPVLIL